MGGIVLDLLQPDDVGAGAQQFGHQLLGLDGQLLVCVCTPRRRVVVQ